MKQKNLFGFTILIFFCMQISGMELVLSPQDRSYPLYIPHDIVQTIAYSCDDHTIQTIRNYKRTCKAFNDVFHYWMIEPLLIRAQSINVLNNGLIAFSLLYGDKSKSHIKEEHYKSFTHFLQYEPQENEKSLKLLGWSKKISIKEKINAYQGLPAKKKINYWARIFENNLAFAILSSSINPDLLQDENGKTALYWAYQIDEIKKIKLLLNLENIDLNTQNKHGQTILHKIFSTSFISKKNAKTIKLLLSAKDLKFNIQDNKGETFLHLLCSSILLNEYHIKIIRILSQNKKCDKNILNNKGQTALHQICSGSWLSKQQIKIIRLLLENKANPNIRDKSGETCLDIACKMDFVQAELVSLLKLHKAHHSWQYRIPTLRNVALVALFGSFAIYTISKK